MRVLVIPEDFRNDQYILKPLFERLFARIGRGQTKIQICMDPLLGGIDAALRSDRIREVVEKYDGMTDLFILCVDRDGKVGRRTRLDKIEKEFADAHRAFLAENAWEELETWVLAGLRLPSAWRWPTIRAELDVKERFFEKLARQRNVADGPGGGRKALGIEAAQNVAAIRQKCPEDFDALARRIETVFGANR